MDGTPGPAHNGRIYAALPASARVLRICRWEELFQKLLRSLPGFLRSPVPDFTGCADFILQCIHFLPDVIRRLLLIPRKFLQHASLTNRNEKDRPTVSPSCCQQEKATAMTYIKVDAK